jgi:hypothetical protein
MAKILIAASPEPRAVLGRILKGLELFFAETIADAERLLAHQACVCRRRREGEGEPFCQ